MSSRKGKYIFGKNSHMNCIGRQRDPTLYIPVELFLRYINAYDGCLNLLLISIHIVRPDKDISNDKHKGKRFSTTTHKQAVNP